MHATSARALTNLTWRAQECEHFEDGDGGRSFMRADYAIDCATPDLARAQSLAFAAIAIYPCGALLLCAWLLYCARHALLFEEPTRLSKALKFMHAPFVSRLFYYEVVEMAKKVRRSRLDDAEMTRLCHRDLV